MSVAKIKKKLVHDSASLPVDTSRIPEKYHGILQYGLQRDPMHRILNFTSVHQILHLSDQVNYVVKLKEVLLLYTLKLHVLFESDKLF